jgi:carboxypeptidase Taq
MTAAIERLRDRTAELSDLGNVAQLLDWDQQTMMPAQGSAGRAEGRATLERLRHDLFVSEETGTLLEAASQSLDGADPDSDDARLVTVTNRRREKAVRVPTELATEMARAASLGQEAWIKARANSDFASFVPYLERNFELARRYVDCFEGFETPYDVLLDDYEPGMKSAEVARLFAELKAELVPMIATLADNADRVDETVIHGRFPVGRQRQLVSEVVRQMGFDPSGWRMDDAVHPFATSFGNRDVRITTRWNETNLVSALYAGMHECGHGLYEAGIADSLQRTPLGQVESLGMHESQSRLWENMVGRGRPFCGVLAPRIAELFSDTVPNLGPDGFYRAVNRVSPSFIRVEADEATYGLHVILRFELEQQLIEGTLPIKDLPEAWNARYQEYLGLEVTDDAVGVLQDVHWSFGAIGYFPTYSLGNLIAGQLWERAHEDIAGLDDMLAAGDLGELREWLREHIHRHGSKFSTAELLERVVGGPIAVGPFVAYLKRKLSNVYGVEL